MRINRKILLAIAGAAFMGVTVSGCKADVDSKPQSAYEEVFAMDTYMTITAYGRESDMAVEAAKKEIYRLDEMLSVSNEASEVYAINSGKEDNVSTDVASLILTSVMMNEKTKGAFDITIYPIMQEWGFTTREYSVPEESVLKELLKNVGKDGIFFDKNKSTIKLKEGVKIDFGAVAKGYTSARIIDIFKKYDVESAIVSLGGNIHTYNCKYDGSKWKIAIENPNKSSEDEYVGVVHVEGKAVVTSGGYERYFIEDGKIYHHIIDPTTGYPSEAGLASVTVISENGAQADALTTALFVMGKERAVDFWNSYGSGDNEIDEFEIVLVDDEGKVIVSDGIEADFESDRDVVVVSR